MLSLNLCIIFKCTVTCFFNSFSIILGKKYTLCFHCNLDNSSISAWIQNEALWESVVCILHAFVWLLLFPVRLVGVKLWISKSAPYASESVWGMSAPVFFCIVQHIQRCRKLQILASPTCVCFLSRDQCNATSCFWLYIKCRLEMRFCTPAQWHFLSQQMGSVFVLMLFMCLCVSVCVHVLLFF